MNDIDLAPDNPIEILYEDEYFVAFNKPAKLLVIPTPKKETRTLVNIVNKQYTAINAFRLYPCHRLDRDTSGVILFAKGKRNQQIMMQGFKKASVKKKYVAFIQGHLKKNNGEIRSYIKDFEQRKYNKHSPPRLAITQYNVIQVQKKYSVVEVSPITGRTNQIRIHFSEIGHPLVGERKYAFGKDYDLKFRRTALHAKELEWVHPIMKKRIQIVAPLPEDMRNFMHQN